jgi:antitoxin component YwqK of YwqJK toxin-antitoxin module
MVKLIALPLLSVFFLLSCGNPAVKKDNSDSIGSKHTVTVSNPLDKTPHRDLDSLYTGTRIQKYDNGVVYMRGDVQGGLRVGEWMSFYRDGKLWSKGNYDNGFRTGYGVSYYENGQKSSEGYYKNDVMVGKWKFWDEFGTEQDKDFGGE